MTEKNNRRRSNVGTAAIWKDNIQLDTMSSRLTANLTETSGVKWLSASWESLCSQTGRVRVIKCDRLMGTAAI